KLGIRRHIKIRLPVARRFLVSSIAPARPRVALDGSLDPLRGNSRHRALLDDQLVTVKVVSNGSCDRFNLRQICLPRLLLRGTYTNEENRGFPNRILQILHWVESGSQVAGEQILQTRLVERNAAISQDVD